MARTHSLPALRSTPQRAWPAVLLLALGAAGCTQNPLVAPDSPPALASAPVKEVKTAGACLDLGDKQKPAMSREEFIAKVNNLLASQRTFVASRWIQLYPDIACDVLCSATTTDAASPAVRFIAQVHSNQCALNAHDSWLTMLDDRITNPNKYKAFDAARAKAHECQHNSRFNEAAIATINCRAPHKLLEIETFRQTGESFLAAERPAEALKVLATGFEQAKSTHPCQAAQLSLLLGEAYRKTGNKEMAGAIWLQTVSIASQQLHAQPRPIADPGLWERIAAMRPVHVAWPDLPAFTPPGKSTTEEAWFWAQIGQWRLDRGEAQNALLAFKRAESSTEDQRQRDQLQLMQARALLQMNQEVAAVTMLARLSQHPDPALAGQTLAILGSIKLKEGSRAQALALLQRAVESRPNAEWPGRAEAQADLGLAYLMAGDEPNGLRHLHAAQAQFQTQHAESMLVQCLANEANYMDRTQKSDQAARIRQQIQVLQETTSP